MNLSSRILGLIKGAAHDDAANKQVEVVVAPPLHEIQVKFSPPVVINGELTDIHVLRKLGGGTDEEAIRVLKASPPWIPGIQNGRKVRVKYNIPISFALSQ